MRTTINIRDDLMTALLKSTSSRSKTQAVEQAIWAFLKRKAIDDLIALSGRVDIDPDWRGQEERELDEYRDRC